MSRKKYTYEEHLKKTVANCRCGCVELRKEENGQIIIKLIRATCKSIHCEYCSHKKAQRYYNRIKTLLSSDNYRFLTLTASSSNKTIQEHLESMLSSWKSFMKDVKKRYPKLKYVRIIERHKSGYVHFHVLINSYIPQPLILNLWQKYEKKGSAFIVSVPSQAQAKYVCKYITKPQNCTLESSEAIYNTSARIIQTSKLPAENKPIQEFTYYHRYDSYVERMLELLKRSSEKIFSRLIKVEEYDNYSIFTLVIQS